MTGAESARRLHEAACVAYCRARLLGGHTAAHWRRVERSYSAWVRARNLEAARRERAA